jgi:hypothetical protein
MVVALDATEHAQAVVVRNCCTEGWKMTMLRLKREQRALVADKVGDLANLAAAGLVLAQFVSDQPFSLWMALGGVAAWLIVMLAPIVAKGSQR